ncbi:cation transporter [Halobacteriales archaeon SW_7_68_16]|nr:MAG: cation transporter [Halobacteriales archaeon SW_7_68_16]
MNRTATLRRVGAIVVAINGCLLVAKGAVWLATGSLAVGSETINSGIDSVYSLLVLVGLYLTTRPPAATHPHGHERIEPFVSLLVACAAVGAGGTVLVTALDTVLASRPPTGTGSTPAIAVLAVGSVAKLGLYRLATDAGERADSPALVATGLDSRNDALTAFAALVGVVGARAGYPILDPVAAALVAVVVLHTGVEIARDNVGYLVGAGPDEDRRAEIVARALDHPEVRGVHDVVAHYVGPEIDVSLHVEVEGDMTLTEAHDLESAIVRKIAALPRVDDVFVHVDPKELDEWTTDDATVDFAHEEAPDPWRAADPDDPPERPIDADDDPDEAGPGVPDERGT